jgi:small subunit ribosomal protein S1
MAWSREVKHPSKIVAIGDAIEAMVLNINKPEEKISLSIKRVEPDPWLAVEEKYPANSRVTGKVRNLTNFGAFVELEEGVDGLVHISDMSWTRRVKHPKEVLKKGDRIEVLVLSIDKNARRISLGLKQVLEDPWPSIVETLRVGTRMVGKVDRVVERGAYLRLTEELEGFLPMREMVTEAARTVGAEVGVKVVNINPQIRQIVVSEKAAALEDARLRESQPPTEPPAAPTPETPEAEPPPETAADSEQTGEEPPTP